MSTGQCRERLSVTAIPGQWVTGDVIVRREVLRGRAWSGLPIYVVSDDPDFLVLYLPTHAPLGIASGEWPTPSRSHPWDQGPGTRWQGHSVLHLQRLGNAYAVWVFWHGPERRFDGWYLNLLAPFVRTGIGINTLDHELDIVAGIDGTWQFKDLDLLESYVEYGWFSSKEADAILVEGRRLGRMLDVGDCWWSDE